MKTKPVFIRVALKPLAVVSRLVQSAIFSKLWPARSPAARISTIPIKANETPTPHMSRYFHIASNVSLVLCSEIKKQVNKSGGFDRGPQNDDIV